MAEESTLKGAAKTCLEIFAWWGVWTLYDKVWEQTKQKAGRLFQPLLSTVPSHIPDAHRRLELSYDLFLSSRARTEFIPPTRWSDGPPDVELPGGVRTYEHEAQVLRSITNIFYAQRPEVWDVSSETWLAHTDCSQIMLASGSSNLASQNVIGTPEKPNFSPRIGDFLFQLPYSIGLGSGRIGRLQYGREIDRNALAIHSSTGKRMIQPDTGGTIQSDDYLLVTRIPGPTPDSVLTVLSGLHGPGTRSAELLFTGVAPKELEQLASMIGHIPGEVPYFQAVFRASRLIEIGSSHVATKLELVTHECPPMRIKAQRIAQPG